MIPYGKQWISQQDIDAVVSVLTSDFLTQGPAVPRFEKAFAKKVSAEFAVSANSATSASPYSLFGFRCIERRYSLDFACFICGQFKLCSLL